MKKFVLAAMLLGLTVGSSYGSAKPVCLISSVEVPESHVTILLEESASFFAITLEEANQAYEQGNISITQIGKNTYRIQRGGNILDYIIDGEF